MLKSAKKIGIIFLAALILTGCNKKDADVESKKGDNEMVDQNPVQNEDNLFDDNSAGRQDEQLKGTTGQQDMEENIDGSKEGNVLKADLQNHNNDLFEISNGWTNGNMFDCTWRESNITFDNGIMKLKIDDDGENASPKWSGAEYRTRDFYHYGLFEVSMKPIKNDGVVSSFFIYTGPSDNNPWDEIDIEFLGKDTTKVQFNYFKDGQGNHEYIYDLGFDASEEFHTYAFEWKPDSITWYVDGEPVHTATENIPVTPGKVMMNVWPGTGVDDWLNPFDGNVPLTAEYDWFRITQYNTDNN